MGTTDRRIKKECSQADRLKRKVIQRMLRQGGYIMQRTGSPVQLLTVGIIAGLSVAAAVTGRIGDDERVVGRVDGGRREEKNRQRNTGKMIIIIRMVIKSN